MRDQIDVGGVLIDRLTTAEAKVQLAGFAASGQPHQIVTANVDFIKKAWNSPDFHGLINTANLVVADGMPLVWLSKLTGQPLPERVTGMQLLNACCELAEEHDYSLFLLGGEPGLADSAADVLTAKYPNLRIAGTYAPPIGEFTEEEEEEMVQIIRAARPTILLVGLGCPKQDTFIRKTMCRTGVPISIGVGGIFNFITQRKRRAPKWMQEMGLEWCFRLMQEPGRLWKRYFVDDLPVVLRLFGAMLIGYHWPHPPAPTYETAPVSNESLYSDVERAHPVQNGTYAEPVTYKETAA